MAFHPWVMPPPARERRLFIRVSGRTVAFGGQRCQLIEERVMS
jgi:hypothetical protein